jgi:hypothetical protein
MRQCQQRYMLYHQVFPTGIFGKWYSEYWPYGQGVFRLRLWAYLKGSNNIYDCISWRFSLFPPWVLRSFTWYTDITLDFSHQVFQRISSHFS